MAWHKSVTFWNVSIKHEKGWSENSLKHTVNVRALVILIIKPNPYIMLLRLINNLNCNDIMELNIICLMLILPIRSAFFKISYLLCESKRINIRNSLGYAFSSHDRLILFLYSNVTIFKLNNGFLFFRWLQSMQYIQITLFVFIYIIFNRGR